MKILLLVLLNMIFILLFSSRQTYAQTSGYYYTYDDSGNRLNRMFIAQFQSPNPGDTTQQELNNENQGISIFPNPTNGELNINISQLSKESTGRVEVSDINGNLVFKNTKIESSNKFLMNELPSGTYFIKIFIDEKLFTWKLVLEK